VVWQLAAALLAGKLIATVACYGFGGCGGIFSPNLFFGGMCGAVVAGLGNHFLGLSQSDTVLLVVGGMSACLGAVVLAPVTAILIIFEMTHQFALVPGLMLAGLISQVIARAVHKNNFYDEVLCQDGHDLDHLVPPRDLRSWQNLPISALANFKPIVVDGSSEQASHLLDKHPYQYFPVVRDDQFQGVVSRAEMQASVQECRAVRPESAVTCRPGDSIRECQTKIIQSNTGTLALTDDSGHKLLAFVTLHDLLRAQLAVAEREGGG
jgi:CIC family chloride channel protein